MSFDRLRTFVQTLRFRLTLWNTAIVLVLLAVNLAAIRAGLQFTLARMVDEFLDEEMFLAIQYLEILSDQPEQLHVRYNRQATSHPRRRLFVQILDDRGSLVWSSEQSPPDDVLPRSVTLLEKPTTVGEHRILCRRVTLPGGQETTLRVGCWLGRAQADLKRFTNILATVGLFLLLIAPLGGYLLADRATRPVAHVIRVTNRLRPAQLDERLPVRGTQDELDQLSQTINHFLDRIAVYLRQSREFTANAAHELRSPLTAFQSSLEIALNADRTPEEYKEVLSILLEECGHMRFLIDQLLILAEGDAGRLRLHSQPLRLDQIVASSVEMFQAVAEAAGVELAVQRLEPVTTRGDGNRLWQVVNNLIDNAIKFTPAQGRVSVDVHLDDARRECVLEVADSGSGIDAHDLPHIFERFYQSDKSRRRETGSRGLGLGLSICQSVVSAHGGTIDVVSTLGRGTTFTIRLPDCTRPQLVETPLTPSLNKSSVSNEDTARSA